MRAVDCSERTIAQRWRQVKGVFREDLTVWTRARRPHSHTTGLSQRRWNRATSASRAWVSRETVLALTASPRSGASTGPTRRVLAPVRKQLRSRARAIYNAPTERAARQACRTWATRWRSQGPEAVAVYGAGFDRTAGLL
jgi:hypothetical protein